MFGKSLTGRASFPSGMKKLKRNCNFLDRGACLKKSELLAFGASDTASFEQGSSSRSDMGHSSQILLDLEGKNTSASLIESTLLVCKKVDPLQPQTTKTNPLDGKPTISAPPKSQVLGKVKDFLGVMSEANKKLQLDAMDNSKDYDIEALTGNESEYIELDLMLGVADLHTPEAVAAAESAIAGYQPVIPLSASNSGVESEDSSDDEEDNDDEEDDEVNDSTCSLAKFKRTKPTEDESSGEALGSCQLKKRSKIVELS